LISIPTTASVSAAISAGKAGSAGSAAQAPVVPPTVAAARAARSISNCAISSSDWPGNWARSVAWSRIRSRGPIATTCAVSQPMLDVTPRPAEPAPRRALSALLRADAAPRRAATSARRRAAAAALVIAAVIRSATPCSLAAIRPLSAGPLASDSSTATSAACRAAASSVTSPLSTPAISVTHLSRPLIRSRLPKTHATPDG